MLGFDRDCEKLLSSLVFEHKVAGSIRKPKELSLCCSLRDELKDQELFLSVQLSELNHRQRKTIEIREYLAYILNKHLNLFD
jgi:hypothetical protein